MAAAGADTVLGRQFEDFLADGQRGVIPSLGSRVLRLLTPLALGSQGVVLGILQVMGAIVARVGFGASSEEIGLELAFLAFEQGDGLLPRGDAAQGIAMPTPPITHLLTQFEVLAVQGLDFGTQGGHFLAQVRHRGDQLRDGVTWATDLNKLAVHDYHVYPKHPGNGSGPFQFTEELEGRKDGFGEGLPSSCCKSLPPVQLEVRWP